MIAAPATVLMYMGELAPELDVRTPSAALRRAKAMGLPLVKVGSKTAVRRSALEEWARANEQAPAPTMPTPPPAPWAKELLRGRGRRAGG